MSNAFASLCLAYFRRKGGKNGVGKKGQTLVEYALVLAVLTVVLIAVFSLLSARIIVVFSAITNLLDTAQGSH